MVPLGTTVSRCSYKVDYTFKTHITLKNNSLEISLHETNINRPNACLILSCDDNPSEMVCSADDKCGAQKVPALVFHTGDKEGM